MTTRVKNRHERSVHAHVEKPTEVPSSPSELRLPACGETAAKLISVEGRPLKRRPAAGGDVEHATIAAVVRGIDSREPAREHPMDM